MAGLQNFLALMGFTREEEARLNKKAWNMSNGTFDQEAVRSDERWRAANLRLIDKVLAPPAVAVEAEEK